MLRIYNEPHAHNTQNTHILPIYYAIVVSVFDGSAPLVSLSLVYSLVTSSSLFFPKRERQEIEIIILAADLRNILENNTKKETHVCVS